ncbi:MAG TPA: flavin-dependent monooxygenase [Gammaproteobacteria bacterium]|nr:flavin-dependent monooxygenase [Gammaproteobacteria bacterium]
MDAHGLNSPRAQELLERARGMRKVLQERAAQCAAASRVPDETIADFKDAGFFKILQSKAYGGYEMDPQVYYSVVIELAKGCMSSAWVMSVIGVHNWQLNLFDPRAAAEVWKDDPSVLVSSSYAPMGMVERVEGGFKLTGHWSFSSGCEHCDWVFLGAVVPAEDGSWDLHNYRTFLLPAKDYKIEKNWDVVGLKGTGSHDVTVDGAFVPEYRTHFMIADMSGEKHKDKPPVYRLPFMQVFSRAVCTATLGALDAQVEDYAALANRRMAGPIFMKDDPNAKRVAARAKLAVESMKNTMLQSFQRMMDSARSGVPLDMADRARFRYESSVVVDECIAHSSRILKSSGSGAIRMGSPLLARHLDMLASQAHVANVSDSFEVNLGGVLFGQDSTELGL